MRKIFAYLVIAFKIMIIRLSVDKSECSSPLNTVIPRTVIDFNMGALALLHRALPVPRECTAYS